VPGECPGLSARTGVRGGDNEKGSIVLRSRIVAIAVTMAVALLGSAGALAQDATPEAESLFAGLGLPELTITATDAGYALDQTEIEAGRYLVTLNSERSSPEPAYAWVVQLPDGRTVDDLSFADEAASGTPMPDMEMGPTPEQLEAVGWLFETYIAGGPSTATATSHQVVLNLPAGVYGVAEEDPFATFEPAALTVTGEADAEVTGPEPEASVTIIEEGEGGVGFSFRLDGELQAGPQIVRVLNASDQPHFVDAWQYPEPITIDQVMATFTFDPSGGATPPPDLLDESRVTFAGWAGTQSLGTTQWVVMNFAPGQALLACFIPDPLAGGTPHAFEGMLQLFEVAEG
jgi:hypothetical protein